MARFAGYVRVSRIGERADTLTSPRLQEEQLTRWAESNGHDLVMLPHELDASGGDDDRPILLDAIARVERGDVDGIAVAKLDRLSRSLPGSLRFLERVEDAGGQVRSVSEQLDASTPEGRLTRNMLLSIAQMERENKAVGFEHAKADAIARGVYISGRTPLGYRKDPDRRLEPDPQTAPLVERAFRMRSNGVSWQKIAEMFSEGLARPFYGPTVSRIIRNRVYLGEARQGEHVNLNAHPPIVQRPLWESAQIDMPRPPRGKHETALLAGIVRCAGCSRRMTSTITKGRREYRCRRHGAGGDCQEPAIITGPLVERVVERTVLGHIESLSVTASERSRASAEAEEALAVAEAELRAYQEATSALGDPAAFTHGLRTRVDAVTLAKRTLADASGGAAEVPAPETVRGLWPGLTQAERNRVLRAVLDVVWVRQGRGADRVRLIESGFAPADLSVQGKLFEPRPLNWTVAALPGEIRVASG